MMPRGERRAPAPSWPTATGRSAALLDRLTPHPSPSPSPKHPHPSPFTSPLALTLTPHPSPTPTPSLRSVAQLLDRLAPIAGIPRQMIAASKAPSSAASRTLTAAQLATLTWDDPTILACTKLSLRLTDGDTLVVRDRMHAAPAPLAPASLTSSAVRAPRAVGFATSASATTAAEGFRPRRTAGVQIRGPQFDL